MNLTADDVFYKGYQEGWENYFFTNYPDSVIMPAYTRYENAIQILDKLSLKEIDNIYETGKAYGTLNAQNVDEAYKYGKIL